jgi:hypothetical protein
MRVLSTEEKLSQSILWHASINGGSKIQPRNMRRWIRFTALQLVQGPWLCVHLYVHICVNVPCCLTRVQYSAQAQYSARSSIQRPASRLQSTPTMSCKAAGWLTDIRLEKEREQEKLCDVVIRLTLSACGCVVPVHSPYTHARCVQPP